MYSKKYRIEKIEQFGRLNPIYEDLEGCICYPAYLNVGERGWVLCETDNYSGAVPHRLHTSVIKDVMYAKDFKVSSIIVTTENTRLTFKLIEG